MPARSRKIRNTLALAVAGAAIAYGILLPFLPGDYDPVAGSVSVTLQLVGLLSLAFLPLAVGWLVYEAVVARRRAQGRAVTLRRRGLRLATFILTLALLALMALGGLSTGSTLLALLAAICAFVIATRLRSNAAPDTGPPWLPIALIAFPVWTIAVQFAGIPLASASRDAAVANSAEIISDIEGHKAANGSYPLSMQAVWRDYTAGIVGIAPFEYERTDDAYRIAFEQRHVLIENFGAREFVVYDPLGDAQMISHDSWILLLSAGELDSTPGWFERRPIEGSGWASFLFD